MFVLFALCCNKDDGKDVIKQGNGYIWLSGGLIYCAEQIHLDNGDTLIVSLEKNKLLKSGDRVALSYKELAVSEFCSPGIDCEVIKIKTVK
ncbi:MAG TPA: hypothetical protein VJY41_03980 [Prolixibacteraceae bacterium]|nr:hypothetical protein [Prolixibacteraceae bacterium]